MMAPSTVKSQYDDIDDDINGYHPYFKDMRYALEAATGDSSNPKLLCLELGEGAFTFDDRGYINNMSESDSIHIPMGQLRTIASRIGYLDLVSTDISIFPTGADHKFRKLFNSLINLRGLKITCVPSELDDFQCIVDILLRSADLPTLRCLLFEGRADGPAHGGPVPIDGDAFLNFLAHHPQITQLGLNNVIPMDAHGAGGVAANVMSLIHDLRRKRHVLRSVEISFGSYVGQFLSGKLCQKPHKGSGAVNTCFCSTCVCGALAWLEQAMELEYVAGHWQLGEFVWKDRMHRICEDEEMLFGY